MLPRTTRHHAPEHTLWGVVTLALTIAAVALAVCILVFVWVVWGRS